MKKFGLAVVILISIGLMACAGFVYYVLLGQWHTSAYAAGKTNTVSVYAFEDELSESADEKDGAGEHVLAEAGTDFNNNKAYKRSNKHRY